MQLRHISPRSSDWMDAMDEGSGGRGWEKLAPEERSKLRQDMQAKSLSWERPEDADDDSGGQTTDSYGWEAGSASR